MKNNININIDSIEGHGGNPHTIFDTLQLDTLDQIGLTNVYPGNQGWTVGSSGSTKNSTLIRNQGVTSGISDSWSCGQYQWQIMPQNDISNLGVHQNVCSVVNDISFSFANPIETGTSPKFFEFDIMVEANNNSTYFDYSEFYIQFNSLAFGTYIVSNNNIIVSLGTNFNNSTYNGQWNVVSDVDTNAFWLSVGADINATPFNRTNITTTLQQLVHIKMEISLCNQMTDIQFIDTITSAGVTFYSDLPTLAGNYFNYDNVSYLSTPLNELLCPGPQITDFTSPVNAGVGDLLTITGNNFGNARGNGQVKFINADKCCTAYVQKLNVTDYVSWSNSQIVIRFPNFVDSVTSTPISPVAIGGGNFIVKNSLGDSAISANNIAGVPFKVYYNLNQTWAQNNSQKLTVNLRSTNDSNGYTFRLNPADFPVNSLRRGIFAKAMEDWICFTGANLQIGADTSLTYVPNTSDSVNYVLFTSTNLPSTSAALTTLVRSACNVVASLDEADMQFNTNVTFVYDSTGTVPIPSGQEDFYGVCLHEIGHVIQLAHNADPNDLMYWTGNSGPLTVAQRKRLANYTSPAEGGLFSVIQSVSNANLPFCAGWTNMVGLNSNCVLGINELKNNDYYTLYPNPSNGTFTIETKVNEYELVICNILGEKILSQKNKNEKSEIDISKQPSGIYFIQVKYKNGIATQKLIIQK